MSNCELKNDNKDFQTELIKDFGQVILNSRKHECKVLLVDIIGEIEGHENSQPSAKTTKYEHVLPMLTAAWVNEDIDGIMILINTVGGDVEAGLAMAEMIASIDKPKVCLVLGGGHSIGVPLAVSGDKTFIVPTATMVVHPIRITGTVLGVKQNYRYIERMQDRIIDFVTKHSKITEQKMREVMYNTTELTRDIGSILVGEEAVNIGIADEIGGISEAMNCLFDLINNAKKCKIK